MPEQSNHEKIEYNGKILTITSIAKLEVINPDSLRKRYRETQDIYEAVKLTKEGQVKQQERLSKIHYKGEMLSIRAIAELEDINHMSLRNRYNELHDIEEAVKLTKQGKVEKNEKTTKVVYKDQILSITAIAKLEGLTKSTLKAKYSETQDIEEAVKLARESQLKEKERISQIPYNGQTLSIRAIAKLEEVSADILGTKYKETQDIYEAVKLTREGQEKRKEKITQIPYKGKTQTLSAIAKLEEISYTTLQKKYTQTNDINKAVMLCKLVKTRRERRKEIVNTNEFGNLTYYDISLILGIKYSKLQELLEQGNSIDDIIDSKEYITKNKVTRESTKLQNGQSLKEYCIENKLNYGCIYWAMKTYGKTLNEAVSTYNYQGQETPKTWIYEKYGLLLKHLMLNESIDVDRVVSYMRKEYLPMEEAVKKYVIRVNSKKAKLDKEWMEELYDVLSDDSISKQDYDDYVSYFYVDEQEEKCIKQSKEKFTNVKRKILLFELAEVLREGIFTPQEEKRLFEEYNIAEDEVDIIFKDLYKPFTDPGILMGKKQNSITTPEVEKKREEKINKYKQIVREIKEDNNIVFMMRFMVGPNVGTNEEYRNEIHKELAKEEMKKQDISSNN